MTEETLAEIAPQIHLSASSPMSSLHSMACNETESLKSNVQEQEDVDQSTKTHTVDTQTIEMQAQESCSCPGICQISQQPSVLHIKVDVLSSMQTIVLYLILIFSLTYSIYRVVSIYSHVIPVEFFFMLMIGIFGMFNFDMGRSFFLPF
jgi:hypothetical protein